MPTHTQEETKFCVFLIKLDVRENFTWSTMPKIFGEMNPDARSVCGSNLVNTLLSVHGDGRLVVDDSCLKQADSQPKSGGLV